jgi:TatD DNase family protein
MELIEIGVNLGHRQFTRDRDAILDRALAAGVTRLVITGTTLRASREALALTRARPGVLWCTAGVHPHNARESGADTLRQLRHLLADPAVVAVGECGLDFNRDFSPRPVQERCFEAQCQLACDTGRPLFLHDREAHTRFLGILKAFRPHLKRGGVVHCFTGTAAELRAYLDLDLHIGITGWICDERRGRHLRTLVRDIPRDRLMLETDAPFLLPRDLKPPPRDRRNEPAFLPHVAQAVASCLGVTVEQVAEATTSTARAFFGLDEASRPE